MNRSPKASPWRLGPLVLAGLLVVAGVAFSDEARAAENSRTAWDFFVGKGLTAEQTAGVLGNLAQESNINPLVQETGGPGRGIAQWSTGGRWDTTPSANANWYAAVTGQNVWSLDAQLGFMWWELTNISGYGLAQLRASSTIADATVAFQDLYERCGTCYESTRISYATSYYRQYAGTTPPSANTQVFETADNTGWRPLPVSPVVASKVSAVVRADGTKIVYSVREGYVYEAASNAGWRNLRVPTLDGVSALSAIPYNGATVLYTIRAGAVWEAGSGSWTPYAVGYNGSPIYGSGLAAIASADGTRIVYTVNNGHVHEAASNAGWRNLQVPNLSGVNSVSAVDAGGVKILYTR